MATLSEIAEEGQARRAAAAEAAAAGVELIDEKLGNASFVEVNDAENAVRIAARNRARRPGIDEELTIVARARRGVEEMLKRDGPAFAAGLAAIDKFKDSLLSPFGGLKDPMLEMQRTLDPFLKRPQAIEDALRVTEALNKFRSIGDTFSKLETASKLFSELPSCANPFSKASPVAESVKAIQGATGFLRDEGLIGNRALRDSMGLASGIAKDLALQASASSFALTTLPRSTLKEDFARLAAEQRKRDEEQAREAARIMEDTQRVAREQVRQQREREDKRDAVLVEIRDALRSAVPSSPGTIPATQPERRDTHETPPSAPPVTPDVLLSGWKEIRAALKRLGLEVRVSKETLRSWAKRGAIPIKIDPKGGPPTALESKLREWCDAARRERLHAAADCMDKLSSVERAAEGEGSAAADRDATVSEMSEGRSVARRATKDMKRNDDGLSRISSRGQSRR